MNEKTEHSISAPLITMAAFKLSTAKCQGRMQLASRSLLMIFHREAELAEGRRRTHFKAALR